jgi:hypothetical protein
MVIQFKGTDGEEWALSKHHDTLAFYGTSATSEDMARAYHAMTDEQVLEMAKAYGALPRLGGMRSFEDAYVKALKEAEAKVAERDLRIIELEQQVARLQSVARRVRAFIDREEIAFTDDGDPTNETWTELSEFDHELYATGVLKDEPKLRRVK